MCELTSSDFKANIELKDSLTKKDRADFLYPSYFTYDCALPHNWILDVSKRLKVEYGDITSNFIWLYPPGLHFGQPAPLTLKACQWLSELEGL